MNRAAMAIRESMEGRRMSPPQPRPVAPLVDHFFRHAAGRLVSVPTRVSRADPPGW